MELHEMISQAPLWRPCGYPQCSSKIVVVCWRDQIQVLPPFLQESLHSIYLVNEPKCKPQRIALKGSQGQERTVTARGINDLEGNLNCDIVFFNSVCDLPRWDVGSNTLQKKGFRSFFIFMPIPHNSGLTTTHIPGYYKKNKDALEAVFDMLEDTKSKEVFAARIRALETGNVGYTALSMYPEYFNPNVVLEEGDVIIDGGISTHIVSQASFAKAIGDSGRLYGFEPDPVGFIEAHNKIQKRELNNIELHPLGLWKKKDTLHFKSAGLGSHITNDNREDTISCEMTSVDEFVADHGVAKVDFLKLDVEGAEFEALRGAMKTIVQHKPKLAISIYHLPEDLYTLPKLIKQFIPDYKFYMGHHQPCLHETILYAKVG